MAITCTPADLLETYSCLQCLSEKELLAVLVLALSDNAGETVTETLENSACYTCLSDKQKVQAITAIFGDTFLSRYTVTEIRENIKCLLCATPAQMKAALVYLLCQYFESPQ